MKLTTWCGSIIETHDRHWSIWWRWALGWILGGWTRLGRELRREARGDR